MNEAVVRQSVKPALSRDSVTEQFNRVRSALSRDAVGSINLGKSAREAPPRPAMPAPEPPRPASKRPAAPLPEPPRPMPQRRAAPEPARPGPAVRDMRLPELVSPVARGQKTALNLRQSCCERLRFGFGWNVRDPRCDIDCSAFMLAANGRVPGDGWFVFYGQPQSPDGSVRFAVDGRADRQTITADLGRMDPGIQKIVFVMTIDGALERRLSFGMLKEAYLRVLDDRTGRELISYRLTDFFESITSMTLGELYLHRGEWKFNPVGNGVRLDLAGQCAVYGVEIS